MLPTNIHTSSSITSYIYLFALLFPPSYPFVPLPIQRIQAGLPGKQATKRGRKFLGTTFFFLLFWVTETKGYNHKNYLTLPDLTSHQPATANRRTVNCELRLGNQTTMCDYTKVEYACYHLRYTVRAWCKSTYLSSHPFFFFFFLSFFFFLLFSFSLSFRTYISMSTARLTLSICVFLGVKYQETHKVPTYLTLTFFFFPPFLSPSFWGLLLVTSGSYVVSK